MKHVAALAEYIRRRYEPGSEWLAVVILSAIGLSLSVIELLTVTVDRSSYFF